MSQCPIEQRAALVAAEVRKLRELDDRFSELRDELTSASDAREDQVLVLSAYLTYQEIADLLDCSRQRVSQMLVAAKARAAESEGKAR